MKGYKTKPSNDGKKHLEVFSLLVDNIMQINVSTMKQLQKRAKRRLAVVAMVIKARLCLFVCSIREGERGGCVQNGLRRQGEGHTETGVSGPQAEQ